MLIPSIGAVRSPFYRSCATDNRTLNVSRLDLRRSSVYDVDEMDEMLTDGAHPHRTVVSLAHVLMISHFSVTVNSLAQLFGLYGNVDRVRILRFVKNIRNISRLASVCCLRLNCVLQSRTCRAGANE